ncbi:MAG: DUF5330 domain-containing protein [Hyphomicrobiales bacterium]|nr:DUF5330 domain-containing protein [Hyphomicrobiales bacterium]
MRNPDVCEKSASLIDSFTEKAKFGAKMVGDFVKDAANGDAAGTTVAAPAASRSLLFSGRANTQDTLTSGDLQPAWQGQTTDSGI